MPYPTRGIPNASPHMRSWSFESADKKQLIFETVQPLSYSEGLEGERQHITDPNWTPGFRARFPWIGFGALFTILLCAASSCIILYFANGRSQTQWPEQIAPNVLLTIMNNIANICFGIAIGNGIAIAWWRKTLKGSSIVDLHRSWAFSTSIKDVVLSLQYFNIVALAAITAKLTLIDSTLMQKALTFYDAVDARPIHVSNIQGFYSSHTWGYTGSVDNNGKPAAMEDWTSNTLKMWAQTGGSYPLQWEGCDRGFCYIEVPTLGFAFDCDKQKEQDVDYGSTLDKKSSNSTDSDTAQLFEISFHSVLFNLGRDNNNETDYTPPVMPSRSGSGNVHPAGGTAYLKMHVIYTQLDDISHKWNNGKSCPSKKFEQTCKLWPAIVKYPVQIQNIPGAKSVTVGAHRPSFQEGLTSDPDLADYNIEFKQQNGFEVMRYLQLNSTSDEHSGFGMGTLSGIQMALDMFLKGKSQLLLAEEPSDGFIIHQEGQAGNYLPSPPFYSSSCNYYYHDPMQFYEAPKGLFTIPSVVAKINQIMFGYGTDISQDYLGRNVSPKDYPVLDGKRFPYTVHYRSNFNFMWGAVAATVCCVLLVLPVYWGFWELGRKVSLNPFEIAHAFRSPVVGQASTAVTEDLMKEVGHNTIRYGPVLSGDGYGRFGVAAPEYVARVPTGLSNFRPPSRRGRL